MIKSLKLCSCFGPKRMPKDTADIVSLLMGSPTCGMAGWGLTDAQLEVLEKARKETQEE